VHLPHPGQLDAFDADGRAQARAVLPHGCRIITYRATEVERGERPGADATCPGGEQPAGASSDLASTALASTELHSTDLASTDLDCTEIRRRGRGD
jgi:hypothetical protein